MGADCKAIFADRCRRNANATRARPGSNCSRKAVKENGGKTRLNTNGLANAQYNRNIVPLLKDVIDVISISLNDSSKEKYEAVCHSAFGLNAYSYMLDFAAECVKEKMDTVMTVVDVIPKEDIEKCRDICEKIGARFRVRVYSDK